MSNERTFTPSKPTEIENAINTLMPLVKQKKELEFQLNCVNQAIITALGMIKDEEILKAIKYLMETFENSIKPESQDPTVPTIR